MAKYINLEELMKFPIRLDHYDKEHGNEHFIYGIETVLEYAENLPATEIADAPTVDAVEVVRCKDCKHYMPQKKSAHWENRANYCNRIVTIKPRPYDFCSYGERKDGDDNG